MAPKAVSAAETLQPEQLLSRPRPAPTVRGASMARGDRPWRATTPSQRFLSQRTRRVSSR